MTNYAKALPRDKGGETMQLSPAPALALVRNGNTNQAASSVITLSDNTTLIEIAAVGAGGAVMKWVAASDTGASVVSISSVGATFAPNFDHAIPPSTVRRFVVPIELGGVQTSIVGANVQNGLYKRVAVIATGIASVLTTEY